MYMLLYFLQLESLGRSELASRLTLNCLDSYVEPQKLHGIPTTLIDVSIVYVWLHCSVKFFFQTLRRGLKIRHGVDYS